MCIIVPPVNILAQNILIGVLKMEKGVISFLIFIRATKVSKF